MVGVSGGAGAPPSTAVGILRLDFLDICRHSFPRKYRCATRARALPGQSRTGGGLASPPRAMAPAGAFQVRPDLNDDSSAICLGKCEQTVTSDDSSKRRHPLP